MESAAELHEARVLRAQIEIREGELQAAGAEDRLLLAEEIARLKRDYRRRREAWRAEQDSRRPARACA